MLMQRKSTGQMLLRNSSLIFFIRFFPTLANLLVILYFSKHLGLEPYGQYQHIWAQYYVLSAVALMGLPAYALTVGAGPVIKMVRQWSGARLGLLLLWPLLWSLVFAFLQLYSGILSGSLAFFFLFSAVAGMSVEGMLLAARRFKLLLAGNLLYTLCFLWFHYVFIQESQTLAWLFVRILWLGVVRWLLFLPALIQVVRTGDEDKKDRQQGNLKLWMHLGFFELSQVVFRWADKFIVSLFLSAGALALYFNGTLEIPFLPILLGAAGSALLLQLQAQEAQQTLPEKTEWVRLSAVVLSSVVFPLFFFLLFFAAPLFQLALSDKYLAALPVFWVMLLLLPLRAYNFITLLQHLQKGALINVGALLDLMLALSLCYPLFRLMGLPGIALAFVTGTYAQAIFYTYYIKKFTGQPLPRILPLMNWLIKFGLMLFVFAGMRLLTLHLGQPGQVLLPGVCLLVVATALLLWVDFRQLHWRRRQEP